MRVLLDTHTFLWFNFNDQRLSQTASALISDGANEILLSAVSAWEISIKHALGRLAELPEAPSAYIPSRIALYGMQSLPISVYHALRAGSLPSLHRNPFDRLLIAQSQLEGVPILTSDDVIARYEVEVIW